MVSVRPRESGDPVHQMKEFEHVALGSRLRGNERKRYLAFASWIAFQTLYGVAGIVMLRMP
jgi:hypothetical protein